MLLVVIDFGFKSKKEPWKPRRSGAMIVATEAPTRACCIAATGFPLVYIGVALRGGSRVRGCRGPSEVKKGVGMPGVCPKTVRHFTLDASAFAECSTFVFECPGRWARVVCALVWLAEPNIALAKDESCRCWQTLLLGISEC